MSSTNVGWWDAGIRGFVGLALLLTAASLQDRPLVALGVGFVALILIGTALFRTCPLYTVFRISTCRSAQAPLR
jgi:hypothetical protein